MASSVNVRSVPVLIVGAPPHMLAVSLLIVEVFGIPSPKVPTEIVQFPHLRSQGVVASRHSPFVCRRMRELQDDKLPCHGSGKGDQRYSAQRKATVVAPRVSIGPAYARRPSSCVFGRLAPCYLRDLGGYSVVYRVAHHQQQGRPALVHQLFQCQHRFPGNSSNMHI